MTGRMEAFLFHVRSQLEDQITANRMVADAFYRKTKTHNCDPGFSQQIRKTLWQARHDGSKGRYIFKKKYRCWVVPNARGGGEFWCRSTMVGTTQITLAKIGYE